MGLKVLKVVLLSIFLLFVSTLKISMRLDRNIFLSCNDARNCNECDKTDHYKKCENNMCYCCDFVQNKCTSQEKNSFLGWITNKIPKHFMKIWITLLIKYIIEKTTHWMIIILWYFYFSYSYRLSLFRSLYELKL